MSISHESVHEWWDGSRIDDSERLEVANTINDNSILEKAYNDLTQEQQDLVLNAYYQKQDYFNPNEEEELGVMSNHSDHGEDKGWSSYPAGTASFESNEGIYPDEIENDMELGDFAYMDRGTFDPQQQEEIRQKQEQDKLENPYCKICGQNLKHHNWKKENGTQLDHEFSGESKANERFRVLGVSDDEAENISWMKEFDTKEEAEDYTNDNYWGGLKTKIIKLSESKANEEQQDPEDTCERCGKNKTTHQYLDHDFSQGEYEPLEEATEYNPIAFINKQLGIKTKAKEVSQKWLDELQITRDQLKRLLENDGETMSYVNGMSQDNFEDYVTHLRNEQGSWSQVINDAMSDESYANEDSYESPMLKKGQQYTKDSFVGFKGHNPTIAICKKCGWEAGELSDEYDSNAPIYNKVREHVASVHGLVQNYWAESYVRKVKYTGNEGISLADWSKYQDENGWYRVGVSSPTPEIEDIARSMGGNYYGISSDGYGVEEWSFHNYSDAENFAQYVEGKSTSYDYGDGNGLTPEEQHYVSGPQDVSPHIFTGDGQDINIGSGAIGGHPLRDNPFGVSEAIRGKYDSWKKQDIDVRDETLDFAGVNSDIKEEILSTDMTLDEIKDGYPEEFKKLEQAGVWGFGESLTAGEQWSDEQWLSEVEKLASGSGVKTIPVENFLMTLEGQTKVQAEMNFESDASVYGWNGETQEAISKGISKYFSKEVKATEIRGIRGIIDWWDNASVNERSDVLALIGADRSWADVKTRDQLPDDVIERLKGVDKEMPIIWQPNDSIFAEPPVEMGKYNNLNGSDIFNDFPFNQDGESYAKEDREEDYERIKDLRLKVEVEANATNKEIEELRNLERKYGFESKASEGGQPSDDEIQRDWWQLMSERGGILEVLSQSDTTGDYDEFGVVGWDELTPEDKQRIIVREGNYMFEELLNEGWYSHLLDDDGEYRGESKATESIEEHYQDWKSSISSAWLDKTEDNWIAYAKSMIGYSEDEAKDQWEKWHYLTKPINESKTKAKEVAEKLAYYFNKGDKPIDWNDNQVSNEAERILQETYGITTKKPEVAKEVAHESHSPIQEKIIDRKLSGVKSDGIVHELMLWENMSEEQATKAVESTEIPIMDSVSFSLFNKKYSQLTEVEKQEIKLYGGEVKKVNKSREGV